MLSLSLCNAYMCVFPVSRCLCSYRNNAKVPRLPRHGKEYMLCEYAFLRCTGEMKMAKAK